MDFKYINISFFLLNQSFWISGFEIRLWPVNGRGTEGFVEALHDGVWAFMGNPEVTFDDVTASFLCKKLGISEFGYSSGWTPIENYYGNSWLDVITCYGNETDTDQCYRPFDWKLYSYSNYSSWSYRYGTRLYCVDSRIVGGVSHNSGNVQTTVQGNVYTACYDSFDMNAANVLCNSLGFNGASDVTKGDPGATPIFPGLFACSGCENSLTDCQRHLPPVSSCTSAAHVTCKTVRLARVNRYVDEGPVEIFYKGSWGMIGDPGFVFDDKTSRYLCRKFGFGDTGFSTAAHSLQTYGRKAWMSHLSCTGTETDVMQCSHSGFAFTPFVQQTLRRGTWLYCFDYVVTNVRLVGGAISSEGRVELMVNGRWGSICKFSMTTFYIQNAANVLCRQMGLGGLDAVLHNNFASTETLMWMSYIGCSGNESSISECTYVKGSIPPCYDAPDLLAIRCTGH